MSENDVDRSYLLGRRAYGDIENTLNVRRTAGSGRFFAYRDPEILVRQYDAAVRYLDHRVEELIRIFQKRALLDITIVLISSDHGGYLDTQASRPARF